MSPRARRLSLVVLAAAMAAAGAAPALAQPPATTPAASSPEIRVGAEERYRLESWDNAADHNDATDDHRTQSRFRTRLWATVVFDDRVSAGAGLVNESKTQDNPRLPLRLDETVFEALWIDVKPIARLDVRAGRQTVQRGDGLILADGTPGDGSRTRYSNGLDASWTLAPRAVLEALVFSNPSSDRYLPIIKDAGKALAEWDERMAGVYYTDTRRQGLDIQAYVIRKWERHDTRPVSHPQHQTDRAFTAVGGRLAETTPSGWTMTGELAGEFGTADPGVPIRAWAGVANVRRRLTARWTPTLMAGVSALSGDSPSTKTIEQWDPVFGRFPKWSEFYVYSIATEVGTTYWTNIVLWQAEATCTPTRQTLLRATYYHMTAFHPFPGNPATFATGLRRGDLFEARVDFAVGSHLTGHVLYEHFLPGSFYTSHDAGHFFRVELTAGFQKAWRLGN